MEYNNNLDILEIKNFLNKRGWRREGLEMYTNLTLRELFNAYIEKSNVILQFTSYVMKLLGINTHNFFEIKDRISGNSRQATENRANFFKMVNHIKVNYLNQLKNPEIDDVTLDLIEKALNMFVTLGKKEYVSMYMVEKLNTRGVDINFSKAENIDNQKLSAEYSLIKNKDKLYYDADLYAVNIKNDIPNIDISTTKKGFEDKIFLTNKDKFMSAMGITADKLKPYHNSNRTSDSLANLILNNLGYDKSKPKERIVAIMTTLKLINYLNHNNVKEAISTINALKDELARNIINLDDDRFIEELNTNAVKITQKVLDKMHISNQEVAENLTRIYAIEDKKLIKHKTPENMLIRCGFDAQKPISIEEILFEQKRMRDEKAAIEIAKQNELKKQNDEQKAREAKREAVTPTVESKIDETKSGVDNKTTKTNLKDKISEKGTAKKSVESKTEKRTVSSKTSKEKESAKEKDNTRATKPRTTTKQKEANSILNKITLNKELETEEKEQLIEVIKTSKERFDITNPDDNFEKFMLEQTNGFILEIANFISNVHTQIDIVISNKSNTLNFNTYMEIYPFKKAKALSLNYHFSKLVKNKGIEDKNVALAIETLDELLEHNKAYNVALQELKDVEDLIAHHLENESKNESIV